MSHCLQSRLLANGTDIRRRQLITARHIVFQIHFIAQIHATGAHLKDQSFLSSIGMRKQNLSVQPARSQQSRIQRIRSIGRHNHLHIRGLIKSIHLVEELEQNTLHFSIRSSLRIKSLGGNGIHLIHKDNRRRVLFRQTEHIANHSRSLAQIFLHKLGAHHADKRRVSVVCHCFRHHRLAGSWRSIQQHSARRVNANLLV
mmetsp:Transcript_25037/g.39792  ORF Transcript_25037/g.39792 Transcript_25037/m.39792 type:complete len:200 (-) Transcript_25037:538-1137(-)